MLYFSLTVWVTCWGLMSMIWKVLAKLLWGTIVRPNDLKNLSPLILDLVESPNNIIRSPSNQEYISSLNSLNHGDLKKYLQNTSTMTNWMIGSDLEASGSKTIFW